jgi:hypothetical protein
MELDMKSKMAVIARYLDRVKHKTLWEKWFKNIFLRIN